mmetsp:Transcript_17083/g.37038  ORF Transcript_17083/g.37038 Transcript_17083/m.37038 type:complete len:175 (-) Transcript_17083:365-889(-)
MNGAPPRYADTQHIIFESSAMASALLSGGIPEEQIFTEIASWDTVLNAWFSREFVRGVQFLSGTRALDVTVLISDFHAARMAAAFEWVFRGLGESDLMEARVAIESVPSDGIFSDEELRVRSIHESRATTQIKTNASAVTCPAAFAAYIWCGGHRGYRQFGLGQMKLQGKRPGW